MTQDEGEKVTEEVEELVHEDCDPDDEFRAEPLTEAEVCVVDTPDEEVAGG